MSKKKFNGQCGEDQEFTGGANGPAAGEGCSCADGQDANMSDENAPQADNPAEAADNAQDDTEIWKDKYARLSAEFDNYRKRTLREKSDLLSYGSKDVIADLLPVLDDIDRALEAARSTADIESVRTGTELIAHKLRGVLDAKGLKEIQAVGESLDTDFHEAVARTPAPDGSLKGKIVDVVQKGYVLKDKVVRHAKVVVGE